MSNKKTSSSRYRKETGAAFSEESPMMKMYLGKKNCMRTFSCFVVTVGMACFLGACASTVPPLPKNNDSDFKILATTPQAQTTSAKSRSAADLIQEGLDNLGGPGKMLDYKKARAAFETLLRTYPNSRWRSLAELLVRLVDNIQSYEEMAIFDQRVISGLKAERNKLLQENDQLKKEARLLAEKAQSETAKLIQENEQLKKDIEQLKKLDIELDERRDKMVR
jgi:hypothetical protein